MNVELTAATEAVKSNLSAFGHHPYQAVNSALATGALCKNLGITEDEARPLCREAVEQHLGGYVERRVHTGGLRAGRQRRTVNETWWIDRDAL